MLKYIVFGWACIFASSNLFGQEIQWASTVIEFSSELTSVQFSANQVLGKPNALPAGGENPSAWTPDKPDREEFIKVGFEKPMHIEQIAVGESFNPSAIKDVYAYDAEDNEHLMFTLSPSAKPIKGRMLTIYFDRTDFEVHAIKLVFDGAAVDGYFSIDAIGISDSKVPIEAKINISDELQEGIIPEPLSEKINSSYKELRPLISPDETKLFFSRRNHPDNVGGIEDDEDIWYSELDTITGEWKEAINLGRPLNNEGPNFVSAITPDGKSVLLVLGNQYRKNGKMAAGVSVSNIEGNGWSKPESLEIVNDYNFSPKANYFMANNRKVLIMSVERDDSYGDRDLYVSFLRDDGKWSEPLNLGSDVNTAGEESGPYLAADDKTMYFSSKGFSGYGGDDLFITRRLDSTWTKWSEPQNLGPDINSPEDDQYLIIAPSGEYAYYSKGQKDENMDIFRLELPKFYKPAPVVLIKGKVFNANTKQPISAKIVYEQLKTGVEVGFTNSDPNTGEYQILLPAGANYGFLAEQDGFVSISDNIDLDSLKQYQEIERDLYLVPVEVGVPFRLNNIFFDFDKSVLKPESFAELDRMVEFMQENPKMTFEISGHTDSDGTDAYNIGLSRRRAEAVHDFFIKKGVDAKRLVAKGYGETRPIATNETDEGRQQNRRVELVILSKK
ncbi:OmpA family protein [Fulvivirgaceae bacterium BMA10]|uniref:OmpA family protein n=1 Tax=Splendidivirga corallicola TaxID=3051826 RepID=A0ABT8KWL2_9BACT|nr:OmpA family protein [Fulvivirgaceae bacterium BMA10]